VICCRYQLLDKKKEKLVGKEESEEEEKENEKEESKPKIE